MCKKCFGISKIYTDVEEERKQEGGGIFVGQEHEWRVSRAGTMR